MITVCPQESTWRNRKEVDEKTKLNKQENLNADYEMLVLVTHLWKIPKKHTTEKTKSLNVLPYTSANRIRVKIIWAHSFIYLCTHSHIHH